MYAIRSYYEINGKEKYKKKLIQELGQSVFRLYKHKESFNEEGIKSKCSQLTDLESEIEELNKEINLVHENALKELGKLKALSKPNSKVKCQNRITSYNVCYTKLLRY